MSLFLLNVLSLLQTMPLSTILPPPANPVRNAFDVDFQVCVLLPPRYADAHTCRAPEVTGSHMHTHKHTRSDTHTHTLCGTYMTGHPLLAALSIFLFYLLKKYQLSLLPPTFQLMQKIGKKWADYIWSPHANTDACRDFFLLSVFFFHYWFQSFFPSFFEATQSATNEKVISDSSLYWD